jgi:thioredoxin-dependent peroxiredoxin
MVDPAKATKGRRMSKKTRKKSPKPSARKAASAQSVKPAKAQPSRARTTTAGKSGNKKAGNAPARESHKASSKQLKPRAAAANAPTRAKSIAATKRATTAPPKTKPPGKKSGATAKRESALAEGARAPDFRLPRDGGSTVSLTDYLGKKLVLFFYPRADTPGCTREAIDFTRLASAFAASGTAILGVSADPPKAQEAFRDKHQLSTPLLSDETHGMLEAYGAWGEKSMYGKTFQGILRTTVLIGEDSLVIRVWRNVRVDGHADEVLAAVRAGTI